MRKRFLKPLVYIVVAAQLLLAVPAMAYAQGVPAASTSMLCDECPPCCPDGVDSMKDCLASCMLAAVAAPNAEISARVIAPALRVDSAPCAPLVSISDPPVKPPPIR